jgi:hypothetical protein
MRIEEKGILWLAALRTVPATSVVHGVGAVITAFLADIVSPFQTAFA